MDASDRELQQYLLDLQGYLVIQNVLRPAEVAELNRLIDAQQLPSPRESIRFGSAAGKHGPDHGSLRTLLYKYCVSHMAWSQARVLAPPDVPLTPRQHALLTEPADPHTFVPSLFSDGPGVKRA